MRIKEYLKEHTIIKIGMPVSEFVCCEIIVDDPNDLVSVVRKSKCYISEIRWWDRVKIKTGSSIGYGGPRDPRNPDTHFFAETDICKKFDMLTLDEVYYEYLNQIKCNYSDFELFPAFSIKKLS